MHLNVPLATLIVFAAVQLPSDGALTRNLLSTDDVEGRAGNPETDVHFLLWTRYSTQAELIIT